MNDNNPLDIGIDLPENLHASNLCLVKRNEIPGQNFRLELQHCFKHNNGQNYFMIIFIDSVTDSDIPIYKLQITNILNKDFKFDHKINYVNQQAGEGHYAITINNPTLYNPKDPITSDEIIEIIKKAKTYFNPDVMVEYNQENNIILTDFPRNREFVYLLKH